MAGRGVLFALDHADEQALLSRRDARARVVFVAGQIDGQSLRFAYAWASTFNNCV